MGVGEGAGRRWGQVVGGAKGMEERSWSETIDDHELLFISLVELIARLFFLKLLLSSFCAKLRNTTLTST